MITVWHNDRFLDYMLKGDEALKSTVVHKVACVATNNLDTAYQLTNHIEQSWTKNPFVQVLNVSGAVRSTSAGDIMIHNDKCYVVDVCGFRELSRAEQAELTFHTI